MDFFGLAGTDDLSGALGINNPYGGNQVSLSEAADVANGPYDYTPQAGGIVFARDAIEASTMNQGYPSNGQPWDFNAATMGISRLIDSGSRAYALANGMIPATYAGQNGLTYANGQLRLNAGSGLLLPLLLIGGAFLLLSK